MPGFGPGPRCAKLADTADQFIATALPVLGSGPSCAQMKHIEFVGAVTSVSGVPPRPLLRDVSGSGVDLADVAAIPGSAPALVARGPGGHRPVSGHSGVAGAVRPGPYCAGLKADGQPRIKSRASPGPPDHRCAADDLPEIPPEIGGCRRGFGPGPLCLMVACGQPGADTCRQFAGSDPGPRCAIREARPLDVYPTTALPGFGPGPRCAVVTERDYFLDLDGRCRAFSARPLLRGRLRPHPVGADGRCCRVRLRLSLRDRPDHDWLRPGEKSCRVRPGHRCAAWWPYDDQPGTAAGVTRVRLGPRCACCHVSVFSNTPSRALPRSSSAFVARTGSTARTARPGAGVAGARPGPRCVVQDQFTMADVQPALPGSSPVLVARRICRSCTSNSTATSLLTRRVPVAVCTLSLPARDPRGVAARARAARAARSAPR